MSYLAIKHLHLSCVVLSGLGFALRATWMWRASPLLQHPLARRLPHIIDSLLLGSALTLAWLSGQYPFVEGWLTAKVLGLLVYIGCGTIALKRGRTPSIRRYFVLLAGLSYAYIVGVALTRQPAIFF
jgi:uncharacterized membrane protein SirB2